MSTIKTAHQNNIKDPKLVKKINDLLGEINDDLKIEIEVTNLNANPIECIYHFATNNDAVNYNLKCKSLGAQVYPYQTKVVDNLFYEYRPVNSF